jgi:acyl dehydratase
MPGVSRDPLYLEDLAVGRIFRGGPLVVAEDDVVAFGRAFDPQPFHTDPVAAASSFFGGLAASGWHTAALCMRLAVDAGLGRIANGLVGVEVRQLRWPVPTRPGDALTVTVEVLRTRVSASRPGWGVVDVAWRAENQRGEIALQAENAIWVARRPA